MIDKMLSLKKSIKNLQVHTTWDFVESLILNSSFDIIDFKLVPNVSDVHNLESDIINCFNRAKLKLTELIQEKSKEIYK